MKYKRRILAWSTGTVICGVSAVVGAFVSGWVLMTSWLLFTTCAAMAAYWLGVEAGILRGQLEEIRRRAAMVNAHLTARLTHRREDDLT